MDRKSVYSGSVGTLNYYERHKHKNQQNNTKTIKIRKGKEKKSRTNAWTSRNVNERRIRNTEKSVRRGKEKKSRKRRRKEKTIIRIRGG